MSTLTATYKSRQKVLGYPVDLVGEAQALEIIQETWKNGKNLQVVTLNAEMVIAAQNDPELDRIIRHAHLIIPDGAGIVFALKLYGLEVERLPGIELAWAALSEAARCQKRVALIGGKPAIVEKLKTVLAGKCPGINVAAARDGYFKTGEEERIVNEIAEAKPDLLLVAMGVPKQEYFLDRWHSSFPRAVMIGVGGSFDVWTGAAKRAPGFFLKLHLEWLYRLMKEPWRYKRICSTLPQFALQVLREAARSKLQSGTVHGKQGYAKRSNHKEEKPHERSKEK